MKKYRIGYTTGVYDMFHIGHLNIFRNAKRYCDYLIVGVSTDECVIENKGKRPIIPFDERFEIVRSIKYVDEVIPQEKYDIEGKISAAVQHKVNVLFVGSDWQGTDKWNEIERRLADKNIDVVYLPHTDGISSSALRSVVEKIAL